MGDEILITQEELESEWEKCDFAELTRNFSLYDWMINNPSCEFALLFITKKQVAITTAPVVCRDLFDQEKRYEHVELRDILASKMNIVDTYPVIEIRLSKKPNQRVFCPISFEGTTVECTDKMKEVVAEVADQVAIIYEEEKRRGHLQLIQTAREPHKATCKMLARSYSEDNSGEKMCGISLDDFLRCIRKQNLTLGKNNNTTGRSILERIKRFF